MFAKLLADDCYGNIGQSPEPGKVTNWGGGDYLGRNCIDWIFNVNKQKVKYTWISRF